MLGLNTIARKLPLVLVASAAVVSLGVGVGSYLIGSQMVADMTQRQLSSLAYERAKQVEAFLDAVRGDLTTTGNSQATNQALFVERWGAQLASLSPRPQPLDLAASRSLALHGHAGRVAR